MIRIPLNWLTRNHLKSMYFGALCIGADLTGAFAALLYIRQKGYVMSFVFKDVQAKFLKRVEGNAIFICNEIAEIHAFIDSTAQSDCRQNKTVHVDVFSDNIGFDAPVASIDLTLSVKKK